MTPPDPTRRAAAAATGEEPLLIGVGREIPRDELTARASRSGGAGGQHVNTSSTRVEVLWNPGRSRALSESERARLLEKLAARLDGEGNIRVVASDTRSQRQNRDLAEQRLADLVRRALVVPKKRRATKPTRSSKERRLEEKRQASKRKQERRGGSWD
jgi:ribosome-associated protein